MRRHDRHRAHPHGSVIPVGYRLPRHQHRVDDNGYMPKDWSLEADDVVGLPVDDLALRVLVDARDNNEWNWRNWVLLAQRAYQGRNDAVQALVEAWTWLLN